MDGYETEVGLRREGVIRGRGQKEAWPKWAGLKGSWSKGGVVNWGGVKNKRGQKGGGVHLFSGAYSKFIYFVFTINSSGNYCAKIITAAF
jgi:hypothetical protein